MAPTWCHLYRRPMDTLSPIERSERMSRIRSKDTGPEVTVRRMLHRRGYRFRLHRRDLPGRPDIVLPKYQSVIFVHGCFWHRHPDSNCRLARFPKSRRDFWEPKFTANQERDFRNQIKLQESGWRVLVVWECELSNKEQLENKISVWIEEGACRQ